MDERKPPKPISGIAEPADLEQDVQPGTGPAVVFFGDPARVREGFALALHAMGVEVSMTDVLASDPCEQENGNA